MAEISYLDVFSLSPEEGGPVQPGDLVRTGANRFPQYRVIAVDGDKAWLRDVQYGRDAVAALARCRKIADD